MLRTQIGLFMLRTQIGGAGSRLRKFTIGPYGRITLAMAGAVKDDEDLLALRRDLHAKAWQPGVPIDGVLGTGPSSEDIRGTSRWPGSGR